MLLPDAATAAERHFREEIFQAGRRQLGLKKIFQNIILLLTPADRHFYNRGETGGGWLIEVEGV